MKIIQLLFNFFYRLILSEKAEAERRKEEEELREETGTDVPDKIDEDEKAEEEKKIRVKRLAEALDYAVKLPYYQRGYQKWSNGKPKTFCNVLARKFLLGNFDYGLYNNYKDPKYFWLNYDIQLVFTDMSIQKAVYGVNTTGAYNLAQKAIQAKRVEGLTPVQAQEEANNGVPVWAVYPGHELIVYPDSGEYNKELGPKVAQAGGVNFSNKYISHRYCWGKNWKNLDILFIKFPLRKDTDHMPYA
jgi:hypothetical protein